MLFELTFNYLTQLYLLYDHDLETHHLNNNNKPYKITRNINLEVKRSVLLNLDLRCSIL